MYAYSRTRTCTHAYARARTWGAGPHWRPRIQYIARRTYIYTRVCARASTLFTCVLMSSTDLSAVTDYSMDSSSGIAVSVSDETDSDSTVTSEDSDLEDLYESFEFEDEAEMAAERSLGSHRDRGALGEAAGHGAALFPQAELSILQSNLLVFQFAIRHSLTGKAFTELLQLLSVHLPKGAAVPKSVHTFKRFFVDAFPQSQAIQHVYCSCCQRPLTGKSERCLGNGCSGGGSGSIHHNPTWTPA